MVGLAIRLAQTIRRIVSTISAWPAPRIAIAVIMSSVKIIVVLDLKRSVSGIRTAQVAHLCARKGVVSSAVLIVIALMAKPVAITSAKEGRRMNAVTMRIVLSDSVVLSDAASMIQAAVLQTKIVRRTSGAKMGDV